jgi:hypothetical protein
VAVVQVEHPLLQLHHLHLLAALAFKLLLQALQQQQLELEH